MNLQQLGFEGEDVDKQLQAKNVLNEYDGRVPVEIAFQSYFESKVLRFGSGQGEGLQQVVYLKPNFVAPQGYVLWLAGLIRKVSVITKAEYLQQVHGILTTTKFALPSGAAC